MCDLASPHFLFHSVLSLCMSGDFLDNALFHTFLHSNIFCVFELEKKNSLQCFVLSIQRERECCRYRLLKILLFWVCKWLVTFLPSSSIVYDFYFVPVFCTHKKRNVLWKSLIFKLCLLLVKWRFVLERFALHQFPSFRLLKISNNVVKISLDFNISLDLIATHATPEFPWNFSWRICAFSKAFNLTSKKWWLLKAMPSFWMLAAWKFHTVMVLFKTSSSMAAT